MTRNTHDRVLDHQNPDLTTNLILDGATTNYSDGAVLQTVLEDIDDRIDAAAPAGLNWTGDWSGATAYVTNDAVAYLGSSYVCILGHTNHAPPNATYWDPLAVAAGGSIIVAESDTSPTVSDVVELHFDSGDFLVTDNGGGTATVSSLFTPDWTTILKSGDQGVTNSATVVDETDLQFSISAANQVYEFQFDIVYVSDATGDLKWQIAAPFTVGWFAWTGSDTTSNAVLVNTGTRIASGSTTATQSAGGTSTTLRMFRTYGMFTSSGSGTFKFQFAQNTQTSGQTATVKAGSRLRYHQLV